MLKMTLGYGPSISQEGDLYIPAMNKPPVVCLIHGGFWRMPHGRDQLSFIAEDLAEQGLAVWNIGYRRVGESGGGWPGTLEDVASAIDHLSVLSDTVAPLDLRRVALVGHSAGGHLALCAVAVQRGSSMPHFSPHLVRPIAVAGLAPVTDLEKAFELDLGNGAVKALLNGTIEQHADRLVHVSPQQLLPLGIPQLILHGAQDSTVPLQFARQYVRAARASGDPVQYVELTTTANGHLAYLDPASAEHRTLCQWLGMVMQTSDASSGTSQTLGIESVDEDGVTVSHDDVIDTQSPTRAV